MLSYRIIEKLSEDKVKTVMVLGASDSGKTSLVEKLANFYAFSLKKQTAILDIDPGQSHIGPPTTVAWAKVDKEFNCWDKLKMQDFYFVGDVSPRGNLLPLTVGARLMWEKANRAVERIIVDTTGLVRGTIGKILKLYLIDILKPEIVLALFKENELDHILDCFKGIKTPAIFKIPVPPEVKIKDFLQRRIYRQLKFKEYFRRAREIDFSLEDVVFDKSAPIHSLEFSLVSLRDKTNNDISLGIIEEFDRANKKIIIYSPVSHPEKVGRIVPGRIKITPQEIMNG
ncbi:hypothetical protein J7K97_01630 [Candidatus Aerophobetes bacterium]|nr:hypothetical protein [Candidatus Aerophobetes bacterium]